MREARGRGRSCAQPYGAVLLLRNQGVAQGENWIHPRKHRAAHFVAAPRMRGLGSPMEVPNLAASHEGHSSSRGFFPHTLVRPAAASAVYVVFHLREYLSSPTNVNFDTFLGAQYLMQCIIGA